MIMTYMVWYISPDTPGNYIILAVDPAMGGIPIFSK